MGPAIPLSDELESLTSNNLNPMNPQAFITGRTSKVLYQDTIRRWIRIIKGCAEVDTKHKAVLKSSGNIFYMECDEMEKELLKQKERAGLLIMDEKKMMNPERNLLKP